MQKEIIHFEEITIPIKLQHHDMYKPSAGFREMHAHVALEIIKVNSGELICDVNGEQIHVYSGDVIFINSNIAHKLSYPKADFTYMQIDINYFLEKNNDNQFSKLYEFISHTKAKPYLIFSNHKEIQEILNKIDVKYYEKQVGSRWYLKAYIYELIAFMYSHFFLTTATVSEKQMEKMKPVVRYINDNFRTPINLDNICTAIGYSKYSVCHYFKAATGSTVFEYINFLRVDYSVEKLKCKGKSILEIANDSGFSSQTYFNRVFKDMIGCSPSVYRKFLIEKI